MEDYKLPEVSLQMHAFVKTSSAVGIYFVCPVCHVEILYPDEQLATGLRNCPECHTALIVPEGKEREMVIKHSLSAYMPC